MEKLRIEGIVIKSFPFKDYDKILTLFTPSEGLIKLFVKGAFSAKNGKGSTTAPFNQIEAIYTKGKSELYTCHEISVSNYHLGLRKNLDTLDAACNILQVITSTQLPEKASPELYSLLLAYLKGLPSACDPHAIVSSFQLKTLRYEGLLRLDTACSVCEKKGETGFFFEREMFCFDHAPPAALVFTEEEILFIELLTFSRDFTQLSTLTIPALVAAKVLRLFNESLL